MLLLMACEMFGKEATAAIPQAIAIELFHNFTLIHDDIMDNAGLRRGYETVHKKFNHPNAILSGDAMLVYAYQYLTTADEVLIPSLISLFNQCGIRVCEGQQMDMNFENTINVSVDDYLVMIELKTAELLSSALKIGAMIGGAGESDAEHLYMFGKELGIAFQLKDDLLDTFGDSGKFGKKMGGDILQNKKTILLLTALQVADLDTKKELKELYSPSETSGEAKIKKVLDIFNQLKINELTDQRIQEHYSNAMNHLHEISLTREKKQSLLQVAEMLMYREY